MIQKIANIAIKDSKMFLDIMYTNFLLPYITIPSRVTTHSKTLIDNIFSNNIEDVLIWKYYNNHIC